MSEVKEQQKKFRVYKHVNSSAQYVFQCADAIGQTAVFVNGTYFTDEPHKIAELDGVCKMMEDQSKRGYTRYIYIDENMREATVEDLDPNLKLRKQIREEERAKLLLEMQVAGQQLKDGGNYTPATNIVSGMQLPKGQPLPSHSGQKVAPVMKAQAAPAAHEIDKAV